MQNKNHKLGVTLVTMAALGLTLPASGQPAWKRVQGKAGEAATAAAPAAAPAGSAAAPAAAPAQAANPAGGIVVEDAGAPKAAAGPAAAADPAAADAGQGLPSTGTVGLPKAPDKGNAGASQIYLGEEANEPEKVKNVFEDPEFLKMMGANPAFIYSAQNKPDPMVFPPIRRSAIYAEYVAKAETLLRDAKFYDMKDNNAAGLDKEKVKEAINLYQRVLEMKDARYTTEVSKKINDLVTALNVAGVPTTAPAAVPTLVATPVPKIELPAEIQENTRGIIALGDHPMCLIGDFLLRVGDEIPRYPEIKIVGIGQGSVTFQVTANGHTQNFPIEVKGWEEIGAAGGLEKGAHRR